MNLNVNGSVREVRSTNLRQLMEELGAPTRGVAVAVNGEIAPKSTWETFVLNESHIVEILTAAAGG